MLDAKCFNYLAIIDLEHINDRKYRTLFKEKKLVVEYQELTIILFVHV